MNVTVTSPLERAIVKAADKEAVKEWRPHSKQEKFIQIPDGVHEAGYGGSLGAGKSDVLMLLTLLREFHKQPKYKGLFLRRTFPELDGEIIPRSREFYPSSGAIYNVGRKRWEWPNGAIDAFGYLQDDEDMRRYDSSQYCLVRWDEATHFKPEQYEYITLRRNRTPPGYPYPAMTRWGSNPGNLSHSYFRKRFIDPLRIAGTIETYDDRLIKDEKTGQYRAFVRATAKDNPGITPEYYARLRGITSEAQFRAMVLGDWYTFEGQVFDEFRIAPLQGEPDHARHVVSPFVIPSWWPKIIGIDWGYKAWCFMIWAAISPTGRVFIYRTYAVKGAKIAQWTRDLALLSADDINQVRDIRICWSAVQDRGQDQTLFEQTADALGDAGFKCALTVGDKNRVAGKQLVHEYLRWKPKPLIKNIIGEYDFEFARRIERLKGPKALKEYASYYAPEEEERNLPKLQFFDVATTGDEGRKDLPSITECLQNCVYDDKKVEDVAEFSGDDPYDCLRILLTSVRDYVDEAKNEFARNEKIDLATRKITEGNDQFGYYQTMVAAEADRSRGNSIQRKGFRASRVSRLQGSTRGFRL